MQGKPSLQPQRMSWCKPCWEGGEGGRDGVREKMIRGMHEVREENLVSRTWVFQCAEGGGEEERERERMRGTEEGGVSCPPWPGARASRTEDGSGAPLGMGEGEREGVARRCKRGALLDILPRVLAYAHNLLTTPSPSIARAPSSPPHAIAA